MNSNYPFNQDESFKSFTITDDNAQIGLFGRTYNQSELVPVNYPKLFKKYLTDPSIKWFPVQQYAYVSNPEILAAFQDEETTVTESAYLQIAIDAIYNYWKGKLLNNTAPSYAIPLNSPLCVVTQKQCEFLQDATTGDYQYIMKFDIVTYILPSSIYA